MEKINSISIIGRRWFERVNGNTYHSAQIIINGQTVHKTGMTYGYGNQYEWTGAAWLKENGYIQPEEYKNGGFESLWRYCQDRGIHYESTVIDVSRKKDL